MIEIFFKNPRLLSQLKNNSFGSSIDYFAEYLSKQEYSSFTAKTYLWISGHFNYWLKTEHIPFYSINEATIDKFLYRHLKECSCPVVKGGPLHFCRPALKHFLKVLREHHLVALPKRTKIIFDKERELRYIGSDSKLRKE